MIEPNHKIVYKVNTERNGKPYYFYITEYEIRKTLNDAADLIANGNKEEALEKLLKFMWETLRGNNE